MAKHHYLTSMFSRQSTLQNVENLDMKEINFNTSKKDLAEAKIHHMLTEVMAKPQLRQRKYRYYTSLIEWTDFQTLKF